METKVLVRCNCLTSVTLSGDWVREKLKPNIVPSNESGSVSIALEFEGGERAVSKRSGLLVVEATSRRKT